jgi:hypothetical protein
MDHNDLCNCPPEAGHAVCELPAQGFRRPARSANVCPECARTAKPVQGQTVKALLSVSLRAVRDVDYLFCRTQTCPVVYFSSDGQQTFATGEIRERVYQKEPAAGDVPICYCFRHTAGDLRAGSAETRVAILDDIVTGIDAGQCACDIRNPQGSCCLGNVRSLVRQFDHLAIHGS